MSESTEQRKSRHLDVCLADDVASRLDAGWDAVRLRHEALPEIALADVDVATAFLGLPLRATLLISSMTGGTARAAEINHRLARGAEDAGIAFALGSGRAMLEDGALRNPRRGTAQLRRARRRRAPAPRRARGERALPASESAARGNSARRRHQ